MNQCDCPTSIVYVLFHEKEILRDSWWIRFERFVLFLGMLIELYFTKIFNYSFVSSLTITKWYNGSVWPSKTLINTLHIKEYVSHFNQIEMWQKSNSFCGIFPNFVNISNSSDQQDSCQVTYIIIFFSTLFYLNTVHQPKISYQINRNICTRIDYLHLQNMGTIG